MKFFLLFVFLLGVSALYDTCGDARQITMDDLDENKVATFEGDTTDQTPFCWVCTPRISCPTNYTRNYFYKFALKNKRQLELSTCNTKTNFNTRIAVLSTCQATKAHTCVTSNDDDTEIGDCNGGKSQIIFTAEANVEYYIAVSGSTASDVGQFQLTVKEFKNPHSPTCNEAEEIAAFPTTYRGIITEDMTVTVPDGSSGKQYYGTWFKYYNKLNQTVFIDTCGGYTSSVDLEIMVYSSADGKCTSLTRVAYDDDSCGGVNPRVVLGMVQETQYYILLSMKAAVAGQTGQYRLNLRTSAAENTNCKGAIGIASVPFMITMPMTHFVPEEQWCNNHEYVGMWYTIVGDGSKYIIDTCDSNPNGFNSGYSTGIEIFPYCSTGMIGECLKEQYGNCGDDAYVEMVLEDGVNYYVRATCTSPDCTITLRVDKLNEATNNKCISPKTITFFKDGDVYEDTAIDVNSFTPSASGCNGGEKTKGAWYNFVSANNKTQHINIIVTPKVQSDYRPVIELHSDCNMLYCIDTSSNGLFTFQFVHTLIHNYRLVYATAVARRSGISSYGTFDFWATMQENLDGDTYSNPIKIESLPYTSIGYINTNANFTSQCYKKNHGKEVTVNGAWYTFPSSKDKIIHINTCGTETHIDTALEVLIPGSSFYERQCYVGNKDDGGVKCGKQAQLQVPPLKEDKTLYCAVISDPETTDNFGVYRASFFIDEAPANCNCTAVQTVEEFPFNHYTYITKSSTSIISLNGTDMSSLGTYYKVKAKRDGQLYILVDDLSEVEGVIALFKTQTCIVLEGINRPQECEGYYTHDTNPYGHRGTYVVKKMERGDEYMIFIGGSSSADGIVHFKLTYVEDESPIFVESGFYLTKMFWVIFGYLNIGLALITLALFGILYWLNNRNRIDYGTL